MHLPFSIWGTLLVSGFLGSLGHCLGMCGPLVLMFSARLKTQKLAAVPNLLIYHAGRISIYALLGAAVGALGSLLGIGATLNRAAGIISVLLGVGVMLFGVGYLGWLPLNQIEGAGGWWNMAMRWVWAIGGSQRMLLLGALNGLLPCGLVYSALLVAASTGGAIQGALGMVLFGVGTFPALFVIGIGAKSLSARARQILTRISGVLIIIVGLQLVLRGLSAFHLIPPLQIGSWMLW